MKEEEGEHTNRDYLTGAQPFAESHIHIQMLVWHTLSVSPLHKGICDGHTTASPGRPEQCIRSITGRIKMPMNDSSTAHVCVAPPLIAITNTPWRSAAHPPWYTSPVL